MNPGFITYQIRTNNIPPIEYATFRIAKRVEGKKVNDNLWLGKVIDKEKGIFQNRKNGYYKFTIDEGITELDNDIKEQYKLIEKTNKEKSIKHKQPRFINFGGIYLFSKFLQQVGLEDIFKTAYPNDTDTLLSLILYRILTNDSNQYAYYWWNETYAKYLYPNAKMQSQRISEFLVFLSNELNIDNFFSNYINYIKNQNPNFFVLIDSTGLKNNINIPITAINNHNGIINNEIRLIVVLDKYSGFPILYKYIPGNIIDVTTLINIFNELKEYKIDINQVILDAGYYSEENLNELVSNKIPFLTRMVANRKLYNDLIKKYVPTIQNDDNYVLYNNRSLFIKKIKINITKSNYSAFAYICRDNERYAHDMSIYFNNLGKKTFSSHDFSEKEINFGAFIMLSTIDLNVNELLPCYYARQGIEQMFDFLKNEVDILPIRNHSEETVSGHLFISFLSSIAFVCIDKALKRISYSLPMVINSLNRHNCRILNDKILVDTPTKRVNDASKALKVDIPNKLIIPR
jgi:transposase